MVWEKGAFLEVSIAKGWKIEVTRMVLELWDPAYPTDQALRKHFASPPELLLHVATAALGPAEPKLSPPPKDAHLRLFA